MVTQKQINNRINRLNEKEKTLLAIIQMNRGEIPATRLKRIYLEKNTLWDLENAKSHLTEMGFLGRRDNDGTTQSKYHISEDVQERMASIFSHKDSESAIDFEPVLGFNTCCSEYTLLWYLIQVDRLTNLNAFGRRKGKNSGRSIQRLQDNLQMNEGEARYIIKVFNGLLNAKILKKSSIRKWADILESPHELLKKIYTMEYYELRDGNSLGREDFGKDNIDFLLEEIEVMDVGSWTSLDAFTINSRSTLFSANQPFRWIHFENEALWSILNRELRIMGLVNTHEYDGARYFSLTDLGAFCLGKISKKEFRDSLQKRKGRFIVHSNFEITLISREFHPKVLLELSMFSDPVILDTMSVFKMSKDSIIRGMGFGLSRDRIIGFLDEHNRTDIPQNVEYSVVDWGS
jgi:hypothetical protein